MLIYHKKPKIFSGPRAIAHTLKEKLPVLVLVGKSNVGKSTLFNHLTQSTNALTGDIFGLTRDRRYGLGHYHEKTYIVIDTGGTDAIEKPFKESINQQITIGLDEATYIGFMLNATHSLTHQDYQFAQYLRKFNKEIILIINKVEKLSSQPHLLSQFLELGFQKTFHISATQGLGTEQIKKVVTNFFPSVSHSIDKTIQLTIVGRPNAGKSTLFNRLIQQERSIVSEVPGTTRDSTAVRVQVHGQDYTFIDTAGIRKSSKIDSKFETAIITQSLQAIYESQVILFIIDACTGITDQDLRLLQLIAKRGPALIILFNKWDALTLVDQKQIKQEIKRRLRFVSFAHIGFISALKSTHFNQIFALVQSAYQNATQKFSTSKLTQLLEKAVTMHSPPSINNQKVKLRYAHPGGENPPIIVVHGTRTHYLSASYKRYLENFYLRQLKVQGTPLQIVFKEKS